MINIVCILRNAVKVPSRVTFSHLCNKFKFVFSPGNFGYYHTEKQSQVSFGINSKKMLKAKKLI